MSETARTSFGALLRHFRGLRGITQQELAERSGLSVQAVSMLERGVRRSPRVSTVRLLASALNLDQSERAELVAAAAGRPWRMAPGAGTERDGTERPEPLVGIPPDPTPHFVGRERELVELHARLRDAGRVAVHGLGGIGKTQLVARFVRERRGEYAGGVFWLRAEHEGALADGLASIAWHLRLPERYLAQRDLQIEAVLHWLRAHDRWLLVLDDLPAELPWAVGRWLAGLAGHVVTTSRTPVGTVRLGLDPLPLDIAGAFLLGRTRQTDAGAAVEVAEALGGLPLALEQAAAYIEVSGRDLAGYADLLRGRLIELMREGRPDDYPRPVATTWWLAFDRLDSEDPASTALLRLCAFLAPDDIPVGALRRAAGQLPVVLRAVVSDEIQLDRAIASIRRYSLIERRGDTLSVHRLVQAVIRESIDAGQRQVWLGAAIRVLRATFPDRPNDDPELWMLCGRLIAHVGAVERLAADRPPEPAALGWLLDRAGLYLDSRANFSDALPILERALALREGTEGPDDPATAETLDNLAGVRTHMGDLTGARPLYDRALAIRERLLGPDHPSTATSLNNLAVLLHRQGHLAAARPLYERALDIDRRALGPDHAHTAKDLNNLARLLREQGEPAAAMPLLRLALAICERTVGGDHPLTATTLNNLARLLREDGELTAARELMERSLSIYEHVLGEHHPHTAIAIVNLSGIVREQGDLTIAGRLARRALSIQEVALGHEHPDVAVSLTNLALVLQSQGDQDGARPLLLRAAALRPRPADSESR